MNIGESDLGRESRIASSIVKRREANEKRRLRFLNAKERSIGVDVAALDAQICERAASAEVDAEVEKLERMRFQEVEKLLESVAEEEKKLRSYQSQELKASWDDAMKRKKEQSKIKDTIFDINQVGQAAAQSFVGEDVDRKSRLSEQKKQFAKWSTEKILETKQRFMDEKKEEESYHAMVQEVNNLRGQNEVEEKALRRAMLTDQNEKNEEVILYIFVYHFHFSNINLMILSFVFQYSLLHIKQKLMLRYYSNLISKISLAVFR
jgi:hypothetical protein